MMVVDLLLRWIHILSAIVLVGGGFFMRFVVVPAQQNLGELARADFQASCRQRWAQCVMICTGLLLLSGLTNAVLNIVRYEFGAPGYHGLVAAKLLLALGAFWIAAVLSGRSELASRFREKLTFWLNVNLVLAVLIVCLGGYMKMIPRQLKADAAPVQAVRAAAP